MRSTKTIRNILFISLFAVTSCATMSNIMKGLSLSPAAAFLNTHRSTILKLKGFLVKDGIFNNPTTRLDEGNISKYRERAKKLEASCTDEVSSNTETIESFRETYKNNKSFHWNRNLASIEDWNHLTVKIVCDFVRNFDQELVNHADRYRRALIKGNERILGGYHAAAGFQNSAKGSFESCKSKLTEDPQNAMCLVWTQLFHPKALGIDLYIKRAHEKISVELEPIEASFFEPMLSDFETWKSALVNLTKPGRIGRDKLRYGHIFRLAKKILKKDGLTSHSQSLGRARIPARVEAKKISCPKWEIEKNRFGVVLDRSTRCELLVKIQGEPECRVFPLKYTEERVGRRFVKSDDISISDRSRLALCR